MVKAENACVIRHLPEPAKPFSFEKWIAPSRNGKVETKRWEKIKKNAGGGGIAKDEKSALSREEQQRESLAMM